MSVPRSTCARMMGLVGLASALAAVPSCESASFACENDTSCRSDGQGWCEDNGACSFSDPTCPSGRRYGDLGPMGVAGECVPAGGTDTSSTSVSDGSTHAEDTHAETVASLEGTPLDTTTAPDDDTSTSAVGTTEPVDDTSGSATSPSTSTSTGASTGATTSTSSDTLTGSDDDPYGMCDEDRNDCPVNIECAPSGAMPLTCVPACMNDDDCPPPTSGASLPVCMAPPGEGSWCVLPCLGDNECPDGMECSSWEPQNYGNICTWF